MKLVFGAGLVVMACILVSGCMSSIRPYDGVIGYKVNAISLKEADIAYTAEESVSWEEMSSDVIKICSKQLNHEYEEVKISSLEKESFEREVDLSLPIPVGISSTGSTKSSYGSGGPATVVQSTTYNQGMKRLLKLKKIKATCSVE